MFRQKYKVKPSVFCYFLIILRNPLERFMTAISNDFRAIDSQETIASVQDFFVGVDFSHFPVLENGIFIGNIATDDLEAFETNKKMIDYKYRLEPFFVRKSVILLDVLENFAKNDTNIIPVLDENNSYIGYYQIKDFLKIFQETPFLKEPGGSITLQKRLSDYSMSEVCRIVETNNAKVLGCFVSQAGLESVQLTIKISSGAINEIIQTFRRYNYEIISEHQEDNYINSLKENSDYLDRYLNI